MHHQQNILFYNTPTVQEHLQMIVFVRTASGPILP